MSFINLYKYSMVLIVDDIDANLIALRKNA